MALFPDPLHGAPLVATSTVASHAPPTPSPEPDEETFDLWRVYNVFLKWLWLIAVVVTITFTCVAFWTYRQGRVYRADATVVIDLNPPQVLKGVHEVVDLGSGNFWSSTEYFGTQFRILKSRAIAEKVIARLGLDQDAAWLGIDPKLDAKTRGEMTKGMDIIQRVISSIIVTPLKDSRVVVISMEDSNPQRAADLANAVAEEFIEQNVDRKLLTTHGASAWLAQQLEGVKKSLEDSEKSLYDFKRQNDVVSSSVEARQNIATERLVEVNSALTRVEIHRLELEARRESLQQIIAESKGSEFKAEAFKPITDNPTINQLKVEYQRLQSERVELAERYLPGHPKMDLVDQRVKKVKEEITHASEVVLSATEYEYQQTLREERKLRGAHQDAKGVALDINRTEIELDRLKREKDRNQQLYEMMMRRQKEVEVSGLLRTNNIRILDAALVPRAPIRPNRAQNLGLALLAGFLLGCSLAVLLESLDNTIKSQDDVETGLGIPLLGIMPSIPEITGEDGGRDSTIQRDLYISANPKSSISECARAVRTSLLFSSPDRPFKVLMVASCGPREGKTTTLISIGITMAQSGNRVLLIDGDLRRPRLHRTFSCGSQHGLSTLILGESSVEQATHTTGVERLFVMPAGPVPPNPAEILQSSRYTEIMRDLASRFDRVIIDSPPVGVVTDALVMAAQADGLVLVLRAGATPKKAARRGKRALHDVKAHIYGAVLNDVELGSRVGQYYNYYHYYRYGYYPDSRYGYGGVEGPGPDIDPTRGSPDGGGRSGADDDDDGEEASAAERSPGRSRKRAS